MSDRIKGLLVALDKDYRDDDCQEIIDAILMIKGVRNVTTKVVSHDDYLNRTLIKQELRTKLLEILND